MGKKNNLISKRDILLYIISYAGGKISGRTAIQKLGYFVAVKGIFQVQYRPHYYGPYSSEVTGILDQLTEVNILEEKSEKSSINPYSSSFDWKKYQYSLTTEGEKYLTQSGWDDEPKRIIKDIVDICKKETELDIGALSWAAKVHYILTHSPFMSTSYPAPVGSEKELFEKIQKMASELNWNLSDFQIKQSFSLLHSLHLL